MEAKEVINDIVQCLKRETEGKAIDDSVLEKIATEVVADMLSIRIDYRWKDYIKAQVTEEGDIYVNIGNRDIDFDKNGKRTGSGMFMIQLDSLPWEKTN